MAVDIFSPAISEMQNNQSNYWGPESFQLYLKRHNIPPKNTAQYISVDSLEKLHPTLKQKEIMIFRLGSSSESDVKGTQFVLVDTNLNDFFIFKPDTEKPTTYLPKVGIRDLFAYQILPVFTETSLCNLALASGLLGHALELDEIIIHNPATGQSAFTFEFRLHSKIPRNFLHHKGQIEIDSLFLGKRKGEDVIFVVEAKTQYNSLAKHKLLYPILAIAEKIPEDIKIIPIYLRIERNKEGFNYHILECSLPDPRKSTVAIDQLVVENYSHLFLPKIF